MRRTFLSLVFIAIALPSWAEETPLDNLLKELETLSEEGSAFMQDWLKTLRPSLEGLVDQIPDFDLYEAPEILENGDIIIRRKPKAPAPTDDHIEL